MGRLHVIVDASPADPNAARSLVEAALAGGAPVVQLRMKQGSDRTRLLLAEALGDLCEHSGSSCIINDHLDVAAAAALGWHGGADDLPVSAARRLLGPSAIVGGTARDPDSARALQDEGASYLGVGPVFSTTSKQGLPAPLGLEVLAAIVAAVEVPVIAIGGLNADRVPQVRGAGAHGAAVIGAVRDAPDPARAVAELVEALERGGP